MRTVHYEHLTPGEILAEKKRIPICYQPIGPLEWHGPHLPMGMDPLNAAALAAETARRLGGVVLPTLYWGTERERSPEMLKNIGFKGDEWIIGMDFPKNPMESFYTSEDVFGIIIRERIRQLIKQGYQLIVLINGHGAENHINTLKRLSAEFTNGFYYGYGCEDKSATPPTVLFPPILNPIGDDDIDYGHANLYETAVMMHLHPENVDLSALPPADLPMKNIDFAIVDGETFSGSPNSDYTVSKTPYQATAAEGLEHFERSIAALTDCIGAEIKRLF